MRASELLEREIPAALLGDKLLELQQLVAKNVPMRYVWDLYGSELSIERIYVRLQPFLVKCALKEPTAAADDAFFNAWCQDAFIMAHTYVPPMMNGISANPTTLPVYLTLLLDLMTRRTNGVRPQQSFQRVTIPTTLRDLITADIARTPKQTVPNMPARGEWYDLLAFALELCPTIQMTDRDTRFDYELEPEQVNILTDLFTWFAKALDYTPQTALS